MRNQLTDQPTDRPTDQPATYRDARMHLTRPSRPIRCDGVDRRTNALPDRQTDRPTDRQTNRLKMLTWGNGSLGALRPSSSDRTGRFPNCLLQGSVMANVHKLLYKKKHFTRRSPRPPMTFQIFDCLSTRDKL